MKLVCILLHSFPSQTNNPIGRISEAESFFDYTNSSYAARNPTDFVPNHNPTSPSEEFTNKTRDFCSTITSGNLAGCKEKIDPTIFYDSCVSDAIAIGDISAGEASIIAYSSLCQNSGFSSPPVAAYTYVEGPGINSEAIQTSTWFLINSLNALGQPVSGTTYDVQITPAPVFITQTTVASGIYSHFYKFFCCIKPFTAVNVSFTFVQLGPHTIRVRTSDTNIDVRGSPFTVFVTGIYFCLLLFYYILFIVSFPYV